MRRQTLIGITITGLAFATIFLYLVGLMQPLEGVVRGLFLPLARGFSAFGSATHGLLVGSPTENRLKEQNIELEARVSTLAVDYVRLRALEEQNRSLQALTKFLTATGYDQVPARVIARSVDPRNAEVLIDRGSKDGVEAGMAVVMEEGVFIGKVTQLRERVATVTLVSDEHSRIAASRPGRHRLLGLVEGRSNNVARLTLIPQTEDIKINDVIVTAGTEDKIPADLVIGFINDVEGKPTDPFKNASLEPLARMDYVSLVSVLRPAVLRPEGETARHL